MTLRALAAWAPGDFFQHMKKTPVPARVHTLTVKALHIQPGDILFTPKWVESPEHLLVSSAQTLQSGIMRALGNHDNLDPHLTHVLLCGKSASPFEYFSGNREAVQMIPPIAGTFKLMSDVYVAYRAENPEFVRAILETVDELNKKPQPMQYHYLRAVVSIFQSSRALRPPVPPQAHARRKAPRASLLLQQQRAICSEYVIRVLESAYQRTPHVAAHERIFELNACATTPMELAAHMHKSPQFRFLGTIKHAPASVSLLHHPEQQMAAELGRRLFGG